MSSPDYPKFTNLKWLQYMREVDEATMTRASKDKGKAPRRPRHRSPSDVSRGIRRAVAHQASKAAAKAAAPEKPTAGSEVPRWRLRRTCLQQPPQDAPAGVEPEQDVEMADAMAGPMATKRPLPAPPSSARAPSAPEGRKLLRPRLTPCTAERG